jgi:hypothetical protein
MTTPLAQIQEEIATLEERLRLLRVAETALQELGQGTLGEQVKARDFRLEPIEKGRPVPWTDADADSVSIMPPIHGLTRGTTVKGLPGGPHVITETTEDPPAKGIAAAIRGLLAESGPMIKPDIERRLAADFRLGKGTISGALQSMKVRGVVARTKGGKWTVK